ncbi:MAG: hypothetical protein EOP04_05795 [Proteobacteria bacterium]|nr:MAG: hypothetical protein EOP04_05795 [Pseudomonadota bacterium]
MLGRQLAGKGRQYDHDCLALAGLGQPTLPIAAVMSKSLEGDALPYVECLGGFPAKTLGGFHKRLVQNTGWGGRPSAKRAQALGNHLADSRSVVLSCAAQKQATRVERSRNV